MDDEVWMLTCAYSAFVRVLLFGWLHDPGLGARVAAQLERGRGDGVGCGVFEVSAAVDAVYVRVGHARAGGDGVHE